MATATKDHHGHITKTEAQRFLKRDRQAMDSIFDGGEIKGCWKMPGSMITRIPLAGLRQYMAGNGISTEKLDAAYPTEA